MFWRKCPPDVLEAKIIERARKNLRYIERLGRWWIMLFVIATTLVVAVAIVIGNLVAAVAKNPPANRLELWLGLLLGVFLGGALYRLIGGVIEFLRTLLPDERDRLLVQYHDALRQVLDDSAGTAAEDRNDHREDATVGKPVPQAPFGSHT
ncbi:MAG TPA: hypothetical protein VGG30_03950 [Pirellulales bacterium]|jgi:uncharacterized membrane protein YedE/YeeE